MRLFLSLMICSSTSYAATHDVIVQDNNFSPANITIKAGDTVRWENQGFNNHNVASQNLDFMFRCAFGCDDSGGNGDDGIGWTTQVTFHQPSNTIPYVCEPHQSIMTGSIFVNNPVPDEIITIDNNGFSPQTISVFKGSRVLFINNEGEHNIKADDDSFLCADGCREDGMNNSQAYDGFPWQFFKVLDEIGSISYHCENPNHTETGVIHVIEEPPIFANGFESP